MVGKWATKSIDDVKAHCPGAIAIGPFGSRMKSENYVAAGVPVIRGTNIGDTRQFVGEMVYITDDFADDLGNAVVRADDLVFPHRGSIGQVGIVPRDDYERYVLSTSLMKLTCDLKQVAPFYLFYFFRSEQGRHELLKNASTVGTPGIGQPLSSLRSIRVPCPPLAEQKAIAAVLGALDDKIELNRRMNATLEAMARALFQSWFVDFDPVRAKLDGRQPIGLDPATAALFPCSFQESTLGEIPHGWRLGTLGELVQLRTDRVDATPAKDSIRYIALEDMPSKSIDLSNFQLGSAVNSSITAFRKGDVLFGSMRPYFHKVGLAFFDGITRTTTFVLRPRKDCFRHFALLHFFSGDVVAHSTTASVGTTIPYVRWDSMESYRIPIPPDSLLEAFEKTVSPLVERIAAQGEESRTLATLRDTLLPKLLSGEIRPSGG
jgi:type I restriction enzyme S subunit